MKILLAIDGSECSAAAVDTLIRQYNPASTEVLVLHAVESLRLMPVPYSYGAGSMFVQDYTAIVDSWRKAGEELAAAAAKRLQSAGFTATTQVEESDARELILQCATKWNPDVILIGSHGKKGIDRFLLGSVSETVARHAPCSVEIIRARPAAS